MKKRLLSILLIICMLVSMQPTSAFTSGSSNTAEVEIGNPFKDVSESDWFYDSVMYAIENDIFSGTGDNTFSPNGNMTRGMYVTVMGRIAGVNPADYIGKSVFADVDPNAYYAPYVAWAYEKKITTGTGKGQFGPNGTVSREQMAVFTVKYFDAYDIAYESKEPVKTTPKDLKSVSNWAQDAVKLLWQAGLFKGDETGNFNPKVYATRAEGAAFSMQTNEVVEIWREVTNTPKPQVADDKLSYTVIFNTNGGSSISPVAIEEGRMMFTLPTPQKANAVFMGWYTDETLQSDRFTTTSPVNSNLTLYAKYMSIDGIEETEIDDTYALIDQSANLSFTLTTTDNTLTQADVFSKIALEVMDGSEAISLNVNGNSGVFTVTAVNGFNEGSSYKLTLNDALLKFSTKEETIRNCNFSIARNESFDIAINDEIVYIPDEHVSNIIKNGEAVATLSVPVVNLNTEEDNTSSGTFTYTGNDVITSGLILCVYSGAKPLPGDDSNFISDDIAYVKVTGINGASISYKETESEDVLFLPDVLPIYSGAGNALTGYDVNEAPGSFDVNIASLNFSAYADMGLTADTTIDEGDFIALYTTPDISAAGVNDVHYGKVTSVVSNGTTITVGYLQTTADVMQASQGYNSNNDISGDALLSGLDIEALQGDIEQQMVASGFANEAAEYFTALATSTEGFKKLSKNSKQLESYSIMLPALVDESQLDTMFFGGGGGNVGIEKLVVKATINKNTQKLSSGIRCAVEVSFEVPIDTGDDNEIRIAVKATFVEELKMSVNASGDTIWKKKWIFPYIADYKMSSKIDVYNFTGISFKSTISSKSDTQKIDISEEMQGIIASTQTSNIKAGVQELFELYSEMMGNDTDWITLFTQNIAENTIGLLMGVIQVKISADFVVSVNINVALGSNFEYQNGTRYIFWVKVKDEKAGSDTVALMDEVYTFQFYCLGMLGIRAGIKLEVAVGLFSVDLNSIGLTAEAGVYAKIYGYFFYNLTSVNGVKTSDKSGALYFELGIYLEIAFKAQALKGKFLYNPTLYEEEWPLLNVGKRYNVYDFANNETSQIALKGNTKTFTIPDDTFVMTSLDLREGGIFNKGYTMADYEIAFTNSNFALVNNKVIVTVPNGTHVLTSDMIVTWKAASLAFSSVPISKTFRFTWDDLSADGYTLSFNSNGGSAVNSINKLFGAAVTAPTVPTKTGYTFSGWYRDAQLTNAYTFTTMGAENLTLYAKWVAKTNTGYKVKHYLQDLNNATSYTLNETDSLTGTTGANVTPAVKNYSGYTAPQTQTLSVLADGSLVISYYYTRNSYTVTFNANGGDGSTTNTLKFGAVITEPVVTKTGHTFTGWNNAIAQTMPASNLTYTATWAKKDFTVLFDSNGGTSVNSKVVTFDSAYGALPTPTRTGFTFEGWYVSETGDNGMGTQITAVSIVALTNSQTLYAKWATGPQAAYTVKHYKQNIGDAGYTLFETQNLTGTVDLSVTPSVRSYEGFTAPATASIVVLANGSAIVEYQYTRNSYTLTFDSAGGVGDTTTSVKYGATITAPTVTKATFSFNGWNPSVPATMPAANSTYTAQWISSVSVNTLAGLVTALADNSVNEVIVTGVIALTNGTVLDGNGKTVRAQTTGLDAAGNLQAGSNYNIFTVSNGSTVTIRNITVKGGSTTAITNAGSLTMENVVITQSGSASNPGGGFRNTGAANLKNTAITLNVASYGGGFLNSSVATMIMDGCSVTGNRSMGLGSGGGGCENQGVLTINNTTFSGNQGSEIGGAINNYGGTLYVINSTISGNQVNTGSGSIYGGGIGFNGGTLKVVNSLIANNYQNTSLSDIGNFSNGANITIINSYVGEYLSASVQPTAISSMIDPVGNGLTGIFATYQVVNGVSVPVLQKLPNNTFVAPLSASSTVLVGGTDVYFDYVLASISVLAYGSTPDYIINGTIGAPISIYQGGSARTSGVIGAYGIQ